MRRIEIAGRQTPVMNGGKDEVQDLLTDGCWRTFWFLRRGAGPCGLASRRISLLARHPGGGLQPRSLRGHITQDDRSGYGVSLVPVTGLSGNGEDSSLGEP